MCHTANDDLTPEAAASRRKRLAEVPFTGMCRVSVNHLEQGWKNKERYTVRDDSPVLASTRIYVLSIQIAHRLSQNIMYGRT